MEGVTLQRRSSCRLKTRMGKQKCELKFIYKAMIVFSPHLQDMKILQMYLK